MHVFGWHIVTVPARELTHREQIERDREEREIRQAREVQNVLSLRAEEIINQMTAKTQTNALINQHALDLAASAGNDSGNPAAN